MNLAKYIFGFREEYFNKVSLEEKKKQYTAYNLLSLMLFILVIFSFLAGIIYGAIIFQQWIFAITTGLFLGGVSFILLLLVLFLNMTTDYNRLYDYMTDNSKIIEPYLDKDLTQLSDEELQVIAQEKKMLLREENQVSDPARFHISNIFTSVIKVTLILILSSIVANGFEFYIFRNKINDSLNIIRTNDKINELAQLQVADSKEHSNNYLVINAHWLLEMLNEKAEQPFLLIRSYSILLSLEIMQKALGNFKIVFDLFFSILFLTPLVLVKKSRKYAGGVFLKEVALSDITTSFMFFLLAQRKIQQVKKTIENEYDYSKLLKKRNE
jgi:hypothetical protein